MQHLLKYTTTSSQINITTLQTKEQINNLTLKFKFDSEPEQHVTVNTVKCCFVCMEGVIYSDFLLKK